MKLTQFEENMKITRLSNANLPNMSAVDRDAWLHKIKRDLRFFSDKFVHLKDTDDPPTIHRNIYRKKNDVYRQKEYNAFKTSWDLNFHTSQSYTPSWASYSTSTSSKKMHITKQKCLADINIYMKKIQFGRAFKYGVPLYLLKELGFNPRINGDIIKDSMVKANLQHRDVGSIRPSDICKFAEECSDQRRLQDISPASLTPQPTRLINCTLMPHQREALHWMIIEEREVRGINRHFVSSIVCPSESNSTSAGTASAMVYYSDQTQTMYESDPCLRPVLDPFQLNARGALLCEEMGLGKTVETLALILSNPPIENWAKKVASGEIMQSEYRRSNRTKYTGGKTLVICAVSLLQQWIDEAAKYVNPDEFICYKYHGSRTAMYLDQYDIVVSTYQTIGSEFGKLKKKANLVAQSVSIYCQNSRCEYYKGRNSRNILGENMNNCIWCQFTRTKGIIAKVTDALMSHDFTTRDELIADDKYRDTMNYIPPIEKFVWNRIVCDESHYMKSASANMTRAIVRIPARLRWAVTGTPCPTADTDILQQFHFVGLQVKRERDRMSTTVYSKTGMHYTDGSLQLLAAVKHCVLRHSVHQKRNGKPLIELPSRTVQDVVVKLNAAERQRYNELQKSAQKIFLASVDLRKEMIMMLAAILPIRRWCSFGEEALKSIATADGKNLVGRVEETEECSICLDLIENAVVTPCLHRFCLACISAVLNDPNLQDRKACPLCRRSLDVRRLRPDPPKRKETEAEAEKEKEKEKMKENEKEKENMNQSSGSSESSKKEERKKAPIVITSKGKRFLKLLERIWSTKPSKSKEKVIVFSQFTTTIALVEALLEEKGIKCAGIKGSMPLNVRAKNIKLFQQKPGLNVFVMNLRAGACGLNLTCANHVIFLDSITNEGLEAQAIGRVHRLGQRKTVNIYRMYIQDTIESRILGLRKKKRGRNIAGSASASTSNTVDIPPLSANVVGNPRANISSEVNSSSSSSFSPSITTMNNVSSAQSRKMPREDLQYLFGLDDNDSEVIKAKEKQEQKRKAKTQEAKNKKKAKTSSRNKQL